MRRMVGGIALLLLLTACSQPPAGERAVLDKGFGRGGVVEVGNPLAAGGDAGVALKRDGAGRLWLAGRTCTAAESPCQARQTAAALWRFLPGGERDESFAQRGVWIKDGAGGGGLDFVLDLAFWKGAAVLAGMVKNAAGNYDLALWALDDDGNPAPGLFGGNGFLQIDGTLAAAGQEYAARLLPDGERLWLAGGAAPGLAGYRVALWRLFPSGKLDLGFDGDGVWTGADSDRWAMALVLDGAGRPVLGGGSTPRLWRLLPDGGLDPAFGDGGERVLSAVGPTGQEKGLVRALLALKAGYLAAGFVQLEEAWHVALWRLTEDGALDPSFGDDGRLVLPEETSCHLADFERFGVYRLGLVLDEEGRILVVGGAKGKKGDLDLAIWRVLPEGTLDPDFCGGKACLWDSGHGNDWGASPVYERGTLWVGGRVAGARGDYNAAVWKFKIGR